MSVTPMVLYGGGQLAGAAAALFTCPVNTRSIVSAATFTNTDTVARLLTVYVVRSGGVAAAANVLIDGLSIAPGQSYVSPELQGQTLGSGDSIQALADGASTITCAGISGYQVT